MGATSSGMLMQFIMELLIISLITRVIGMIFKIKGAELIEKMANIASSVPIFAVLGVILFSSAVDIFFKYTLEEKRQI